MARATMEVKILDMPEFKALVEQLRDERNALRRVLCTWLATGEVQVWPDGLWTVGEDDHGHFDEYDALQVANAVAWANDVLSDGGVA